ncbi:MAG: hypothetical protein WC135_01270 [Bacteroidales bacterium]
MITKDNYQAYLLDFLEGNLSSENKRELELFLEKNPQFADELKAYDESLFLSPDLGIKFEDKESLMHKKRFIFPIWAKYSSSAAVILLLIGFSFTLFLNPYSETNITIDSPIAQNTSKPIIIEENITEEPQQENLIEKMKNTSFPSKEAQTTTPKVVSQTQTEPKANDIIIEKEPRIILSNSLVVYEVDNLISYTVEDDWKADKVYEVDNLIVYKDNTNSYLSPYMKNKHVANLANKIEDRVDKTQDSFNNALAYIQENINNNPFSKNKPK